MNLSNNIVVLRYKLKKEREETKMLENLWFIAKVLTMMIIILILIIVLYAILKAIIQEIKERRLKRNEKHNGIQKNKPS